MSWDVSRSGSFFVTLLALVALLVWAIVRQRRRHGVWTRQAYPYRRSQMMRALWFFAGCLALALAYLRPSWGFEERPKMGRRQDVMVVLDISHSMLAQDVAPNRFQRARREILDLLAASSGARVGLVVAGETAFLQCPLTRDAEALRLFMDGVREDEAEGRGSNLGNGVRLAVETLQRARDEDRPGQSILVLSDGEDHGGEALAAAAAAKDAGIRLDVLGIGTSDGAPLPERGGGWKKDEEGRIIVSRLNGDLLKELAGTGGGVYEAAAADDSDLVALGLFTKPAEMGSDKGMQRVPRERYPAFIWVGFFILLAEGWSRRGRRRVD